MVVEPVVIFQRPTWDDWLSVVAKIAQPRSTFVHCCLSFDGKTVLDNSIIGLAVYSIDKLQDNVEFVPVRLHHLSEIPVWDDRPLHLPALVKVALTGDNSLMTCASWVCLMLGIYPRYNKPDELWRFLMNSPITDDFRQQTVEDEDNRASEKLGDWQAVPTNTPLGQDTAINDNGDDVLVGNDKVYRKLD